jgi:hypothetical protein
LLGAVFIRIRNRAPADDTGQAIDVIDSGSEMQNATRTG